jgi:predicted transcriptional regulator
MELHMTPETEAKLDELALRTHRAKDELLEEAVNHLLVYHEWLERKVTASQAAAAQGHIVSDEHVRAWVEQRERS